MKEEIVSRNHVCRGVEKLSSLGVADVFVARSLNSGEEWQVSQERRGNG